MNWKLEPPHPPVVCQPGEVAWSVVLLVFLTYHRTVIERWRRVGATMDLRGFARLVRTETPALVAAVEPRWAHEILVCAVDQADFLMLAELIRQEVEP
jgi:hypothetical protein